MAGEEDAKDQYAFPALARAAGELLARRTGRGSRRWRSVAGTRIPRRSLG